MQRRSEEEVPRMADSIDFNNNWTPFRSLAGVTTIVAVEGDLEASKELGGFESISSLSPPSLQAPQSTLKLVPLECGGNLLYLQLADSLWLDDTPESLPRP